jgi:flagellar basal-body rod protein FlgC
MEAALHNAVSGLRAAGKRLEISASNTVNARSENYAPVRAVQSAQPGGGTRAEAMPVSPPTVPVYDPQHPAADANGVAQRPNVALESEAVEQILAQRAFEANLKTVQTADRMTRTLLDILA